MELLKQYLTEIPNLRGLHYDNQDFELWASKIGNVIKAALDSEDLRTFISAHPIAIPRKGMSESSFIEYYQEDINLKETAIKKIIQKYEILGLDKGIVTKTGVPITKTEPTYRVPTPIQLFNAMQFHPKLVEASESLFVDTHYSEAIEKATKALIELVKQKTGYPKNKSRNREIDGKDLMSKVFNEEKPMIALNNLKRDSDRDEQEGFRFLYMGTVVGIKNPKSHSLANLKDPYKSLEYLSLISLLMKRADEGKLIESEQTS